MKKGRHRRYEEARALKRTDDGFDDILAPSDAPCVECDGLPGAHKSWCQLAGDRVPVGYEDNADDSSSLFPT